MRADNPVTQRSKIMVPILSEHDYYRAEIEHIQAYAILVPIDRVWIEQVLMDTSTIELPTTDHPRMREAVSALSASTILGLRLAQAVPDGFVRDLRAVTDVYEGVRSDPMARVCSEAEWYRWAIQGAMPATTEVPAHLLWRE
jgi:hypothetical protein